MIVYFYTVDPYGIKALNALNFANLSKSGKFRSIEILINFNSYGFFREACRINRIKIKDNLDKIIGDLEEYDNTPIESYDTLTKIIGTNEWIDIIARYSRNKINTFQAEIEIGNLFCNKLREGFRYVLNMPIRMNDEVGTKYRLVHCCNHIDGCLLVANNRYKRSQEQRQQRFHGQMTFLDYDVNDLTTNDDDIKKYLMTRIELRGGNEIHLSHLIADFFINVGILCNEQKLVSILKELEKESFIKVRRNPEITPSTGKKSDFWHENKEHQIFIRKIML